MESFNVITIVYLPICLLPLNTCSHADKHHVLVYIEDAIHQLLEHKDDNPKVNTTKFLSEYFVSVRSGNHTLFREFSFIKATPHNRACFVKTFSKCYRNIGRKGDLLGIKEYHSLLCLLCNDFPFSIVQKTAKIILMDDSLDTLISFTDFLYAFQVQFCYDEFLTRCAEIYKELLKTKQNSHDPVYVPTSEEATPRVHEDESTNKPDGVDAMTYLRALIPLCEHYEKLAPPLPVLRDLLSNAERVTFYGYLLALAKSDRLSSAIGKIPNRVELLENTEPELTAPPLRPGSAKSSSTVQQQNTMTKVTSSAPSTPATSSQGNSLNGTGTSAGAKSVPQMKSTRLQKKLLRKQVSSDSDDDTDDSSDTN